MKGSIGYRMKLSLFINQKAVSPGQSRSFDLVSLNGGKGKGGNAIVSQWKKENEEPKYTERLFCESS